MPVPGCLLGGGIGYFQQENVAGMALPLAASSPLVKVKEPALRPFSMGLASDAARRAMHRPATQPLTRETSRVAGRASGR